MPQFRKKPIVIEAFQMTTDARKDDVDWPEWLCAAYQIPMELPGSVYFVSSSLCINTLEGGMVVSVNDWIIKGVNGELYPCKPDIFAMTYEPV